MDHQSQADNYYDNSEPTGDDGNSYEEDSDGDVYDYNEIIETFEELRQSNYYPFLSKIIFALFFFLVNSPHPVVCSLPSQMCCIIELYIISIRVTEISPFFGLT